MKADGPTNIPSSVEEVISSRVFRCDFPVLLRSPWDLLTDPEEHLPAANARVVRL